MLKIRLKRFGRTHLPFYRIIVIEARTKRQGRAVDEIGYIDPIKKDRKIDKEKALYWLSVGAQPTFTVERFLISEKILDKKDYPVRKFEFAPGEKSKTRKAEKEAAKANKKEAKAETPVGDDSASLATEVVGEEPVKGSAESKE